MSAYVLSLEHIRYLVAAGTAKRIFADHSSLSWIWGLNHENGTYQRASLYCSDHTQATRVGQMLLDENVKSVSYRYEKDGEYGPLPGATERVFNLGPSREQDFSPPQVMKACDCYSYHSCEHPSWHDSEAKAYVTQLFHEAATRVDGYDAAVWSIE